LLAISNQSDGAFNANLQAFLAKFEPKIFWHVEAFGESSKSVGLFFLREEIGEKPLQTCFGVSKAITRFISMDFKKRKRVDQFIAFRTFQFILLMRYP
jgi:hypothetical protein